MTSPLKEILEEAITRGHSEEYQRDITEYVNGLLEKNLPIIFSRKHLSLLLGMNQRHLNELIHNSSDYYKRFKLRKRNSSGFRFIQSPNSELKYVQKWIKENILDKFEISASANGFVKGRSICDNANVHIASDLVLNVDLYRFFDSITERRIFGLFRWMGYHGNLARDFSKLLCYKPTIYYWDEVREEGIFSEDFVKSEQRILPQGSPASPAISNLICYSMDKRLEGVAKAQGINYSRYADDLTFSGSRKSMVSLRLIKQICNDEGFLVNESKTKYLPQSNRQLVTGLVVNAGVRVPSNLKREINKHLFFARTRGVKNHLDWTNIDDTHHLKANFREYLLGHIYFVKSVEPNVGQKMLEQFNMIVWEI